MKIPHNGAHASHLILCVTYFLFTFLLLAIGYYEYLRTLDSLSIFLPTGMFWADCMHTPGGAVIWLGCWLTQYFYHPWLGAAIYAAISAVTIALTAKAFRLRGPFYGFAVIPSAMMLLWLLLPGYVIFSLRTTGYAYFGLLSVVLCASVFLGYRHIRPIWLRIGALVALVAIGYPLAGVGALLTATACSVYELSLRRPLNLLTSAIGLLSVGAYPYLYFRAVPTILTPSNIYIAGMPNLMADELGLWMPYIVCAAAIVVFAMLMGISLPKTKKKSWLLQGSGYAAFALSIVAVLTLRYNDPNFTMSIALSRAIEDGDWQKAADKAREIDFTPTRLNTLYTYIALMRQGVAEEQMFTYPSGSERYDSPRESNAMRDAAGMAISYHFGRPNNAYRWAMEYKVEYGLKVEYLKYLAKCALLNGEYPLARKYLETLAQTRYHSGWAKKYLTYVDDPKLMSADTEMAQLTPLMLFRDHLGGDGGKIETYLIPILSGLDGGTPELQNLSQICTLIQKDVNLFMRKYGKRAMGLKHIPRHYQEAILTWSMIHQTPAYKQFNIDQYVMARFDRFMSLNRQYLERPKEEKQQALKPEFGDTYWYYYFFGDELKIN